MQINICGNCLLLGNVTWYLMWVMELWYGIPRLFWWFKLGVMDSKSSECESYEKKLLVGKLQS